MFGSFIHEMGELSHLRDHETVKAVKDRLLNRFSALYGKIAEFFHSFVTGDLEGLNEAQKKFRALAQANEQKATEIRQAFLEAVDAGTAKAKAAPAETAKKGDVLHQIRLGMTDEERYLALKDRVMTDIPEVTQDLLKGKSITSWEDINKVIGSEKRDLIRKLAEQFEAFKTYYNKDIELDFEYSRNNYRESYGKQEKNFADFAKLFSVFDKVINNAVGIEVHNKNAEGYKVDPTLKNVFVLISAFKEGENLIPVKLEVKEFTDKLNKLYVAVSLEKIKAAEVFKQGNTKNGVTQNSRSADISIAKLLRFVKNSGDERLAKYNPAQFANYTNSAESNDIRRQSRYDPIDDAAIKHFGKAYLWNETGYLLKDGTRLDFSGKNDGAPGGYRTVDHRDIWDIYPEEMRGEFADGEYGDGTNAMIRYMADGNIRIMPESNGINLSVKPTRAQFSSFSCSPFSILPPVFFKPDLFGSFFAHKVEIAFAVAVAER